MFTQRKSLFPVCNKTQTPGECQGAARLPTPDTSSSKQNHRDKPGKVRATAEVRLQDGSPPLPHLHILNKNLKGGTCKTGKVLIVIHIGVNSPISGRCQKFEVKPGELVLIIRGILTLLHLSHGWLLCWALYKPWMGISGT